jgi:hypothetical protein
MLLHLKTMPPAFVLGAFNPFGLTARSMIIAKGVKGPEDLNREELRVLEMPAANGTGDARSMEPSRGSSAFHPIPTLSTHRPATVSSGGGPIGWGGRQGVWAKTPTFWLSTGAFRGG